MRFGVKLIGLVVLALGLLNATSSVLTIAQSCGVSPDGQWECHWIPVKVQVKGRTQYEERPLEGITVEIFHFDEGQNGIWRSYRTNSNGEVTTNVQSWVPQGSGYEVALKQASNYVQARANVQWPVESNLKYIVGPTLEIRIVVRIPVIGLPPVWPPFRPWPLAGGFSIVARHSGKCLDVWNASRDSGVNIIQWDCHGGDNQKFELRP